MAQDWIKLWRQKKKLSKSELATLVQIVFRRHWRDAKWICLRQDRRFKWRKHWLWGKHDARRIYMCLFTNLDNGKEWTDTQFGYRVCRVIFIILAPPLGVNKDSPVIISNPKCSGKKNGIDSLGLVTSESDYAHGESSHGITSPPPPASLGFMLQTPITRCSSVTGYAVPLDHQLLWKPAKIAEVVPKCSFSPDKAWIQFGAWSVVPKFTQRTKASK